MGLNQFPSLNENGPGWEAASVWIEWSVSGVRAEDCWLSWDPARLVSGIELHLPESEIKPRNGSCICGALGVKQMVHCVSLPMTQCPSGSHCSLPHRGCMLDLWPLFLFLLPARWHPGTCCPIRSPYCDSQTGGGQQFLYREQNRNLRRVSNPGSEHCSHDSREPPMRGPGAHHPWRPPPENHSL